MKHKWTSVIAMTTVLGVGVGSFALSAELPSVPSRFGMTTAQAATISTPIVYTAQVDNVAPGQAFQLAGWGYTSQTQVKVWVVRSNSGKGDAFHLAIPSTPPADAYTLQNLSSTNDSLVSMLPSTVPTGIYAVYTSNDGVNWSKPYVYNKPDPWYLEYQTAAPGQTNMVLGNNLKFGDNATVTLYSQDSGRKITCDVTNSDDNQISFVVPSNTTPGTYSMYIGNGSGGDLGLANNLTLTVATTAVPPTTIYDVVQGYGADPTGAKDSTSEIQQALDSAANNPDGGIVFFPAGTYTISSKLSLSAAQGHVVLMGAGMNKTLIQESSTASYAEPQPYPDIYNVSQSDPYGMLYLSPGNNPVTIDQLGFNTNANATIALEIDGRNNVTVNQDDFKADVMNPGATPLWRGIYGIYAQNNKEFTLSNSVLYANNAFMGENETDIRILSNQMHLDYPQANSQPVNCGIQMWGSKRVTIMHNNFDRDGSTYYYGNAISFGALKTSTVMYGVPDTAYQADTYIGYNTMNSAGSPHGNNGSIAVGDTDSGVIPGAGHTLSVSSATSNTVSVATPTFNVFNSSDASTNDDDSQMSQSGAISAEQTNPIGAYVYITSGTGTGEVRRVIANTSTQLTLNAPWDVVPDSTSKFIVQLSYEHNAYVNNTATQAQGILGIYSSGAFNIVSNNHIDGTGAVTPSGPDGQAIPGTSLWSTIDPTSNNPGSSAQNPSFYNEMEGNVINAGTVFTDDPSFSSTLHQPDYPVMRGNVIANNEVINPPSSGSSSPAGTVMGSSSGTWGRDNLIINESVSGVGSPQNVSIGSGYDRTIIQGSTPVVDSGTNTVSVQ